MEIIFLLGKSFSDRYFIPWCSAVLSSSRRDTCSARSVSSPFETAAVLSSSDSIVHALQGALYLECATRTAAFNLTLIKRILFPVKWKILGYKSTIYLFRARYHEMLEFDWSV